MFVCTLCLLAFGGFEFQCGFMQWLEWHQRIGLVNFIHWWEDEHDCCRWMGLSISLMGLWVLCSVIEFGLATSLVSWCIVCYRWSWLVDFIDEAVRMRPTITVLVDVASRGGKSGLSNKPISHNLSVSLNKTTQRRTRSSRKWTTPAPLLAFACGLANNKLYSRKAMFE